MPALAEIHHINLLVKWHECWIVDTGSDDLFYLLLLLDNSWETIPRGFDVSHHAPERTLVTRNGQPKEMTIDDE